VHVYCLDVNALDNLFVGWLSLLYDFDTAAFSIFMYILHISSLAPKQ